MRALQTDHGFTISVFVAITAIFAFVLEASQELVATLLISGILTAAAEHFMRSTWEHRP
jgi:predicted PurR-regulated permease PerM